MEEKERKELEKEKLRKQFETEVGVLSETVIWSAGQIDALINMVPVTAVSEAKPNIRKSKCQH